MYATNLHYSGSNKFIKQYLFRNRRINEILHQRGGGDIYNFFSIVIWHQAKFYKQLYDSF